MWRPVALLWWEIVTYCCCCPNNLPVGLHSVAHTLCSFPTFCVLSSYSCSLLVVLQPVVISVLALHSAAFCLILSFSSCTLLFMLCSFCTLSFSFWYPLLGILHPDGCIGLLYLAPRKLNRLQKKNGDSKHSRSKKDKKMKKNRDKKRSHNSDDSDSSGEEDTRHAYPCDLTVVIICWLIGRVLFGSSAWFQWWSLSADLLLVGEVFVFHEYNNHLCMRKKKTTIFFF